MIDNFSEAYRSVKWPLNDDTKTKPKLEAEKKKHLDAKKMIHSCLYREKPDMEDIQTIKTWIKQK